MDDYDIGIKYKVFKFDDDLFFLFPVALVEGAALEYQFYSKSNFNILDDQNSLSGKYVVDNIISIYELIEEYDFDDVDFIKKYYFEEERENIEIVSFSDLEAQKLKINKNIFTSLDFIEVYESENNKTTISLNENALDELLNSVSLSDIKEKLEKYKELSTNIKKKEKTGTTKVVVKNGKVSEIEVKNKIIGVDNYKNKEIDKDNKKCMSDISLSGLENYIKERVLGHDKEIRKLAKTIIMNYTALESEKNEPILILGPTGTGKTETMNAISNYLDIPLVEVNTVNLVPQGIKGMSLEDCLYALIADANYDIEKAEKGMIFFDEFDKLGKIDVDYKSPVTQILLKFVEGGNFLLNEERENYNFNTKMLIKTFAGAFSELFEKKKVIGFSGEINKTNEFKPKNITEKEYFGKELVTRIPHILVFKELTKEDKKNIILYSKISEFLIKKERYQRQFGVELEIDDTYIEALLNKLDSEQRSMRELNNLIIESLDEAEYEMLTNKNYKKLSLNGDTVLDNKKFILK